MSTSNLGLVPTASFHETANLKVNRVNALDENPGVAAVLQSKQSTLGTETITKDPSNKITKSNDKLWACFLQFAVLGRKDPLLTAGPSPKPSCAHSTSSMSNGSAVEVKRKWRQVQISNIRAINCVIDSSWRKSQIPILWCGWLQKRSSGIAERWQARLFELRQEPNPTCGDANGNRAVLQYYGRGGNGGENAKRLELIDARRDKGHDGAGRACFSVVASGRSGRVLLGAASERETASLLSCIRFIMRP
jgi:hypothetical protein